MSEHEVAEPARAGSSSDHLHLVWDFDAEAWQEAIQESLHRLDDLHDVFGWAADRTIKILRQAFGIPHIWIGEAVDPGVQIVRPAKGYSTWYGWREGRWVPVRRWKGVGWVWSA